MKLKHRFKKIVGFFTGIILLCELLLVRADNVKISQKEYGITLNNALNLFVSNDKPVSGKVGSKVFLTYTVDDISLNTAFQNGIIATADHDATFPYTKGMGALKCVNNRSVLLDNGFTYVLRLEHTKNGFEYKCAKLKGKKASYITFTNSHGETDGDFKYFGFWIGGDIQQSVKAKLSHVHCYDENGNDLGIHFNGPSAMETSKMNSLLDVHFTENQNYSFKFDDNYSIAISNKKAATTNVVYMEYEVGKVTKDESYQEGLIATDSPQVDYPHSLSNGGLLQYISYEKSIGKTLLLHEGAKYFICFSKKPDGFDGLVQCTEKKETSTFSFASKVGVYSPNYKYFSLWLGEAPTSKVSCEIKNFKCYDSNGNNLGVQINKKEVIITHNGEIENYDKSTAAYYCLKNKGLIILDVKQRAYLEINNLREDATYKISDSKLFLLFKSGKEIYNYCDLLLTDGDGNKYVRLQNAKVTFVDGDNITEEKVNIKNEFRVKEPVSPKKKNNTFAGWYLKNGKTFDFNKVVTKSLTLYAKWKDSDGNNYIDVGSSASSTNMIPIVVGIICVVIVVACVLICLKIMRKKRF